MAFERAGTLLFDILPDEILQYIISYILPIYGDRDSFYPCLFLAESCPSQRRALLRALSFRLEITRHMEQVERWVRLAGNDIEKLEVLTGPKYFPHAVVQALQSRGLRQVSMFGEPIFLSAIKSAPSLRTLELSIYRRAHVQILAEILPTLNLKDLFLSLQRMTEGGAQCPLKPLLSSEKTQETMCPSLSNLGLSCTCSEYRNDYPCFVWVAKDVFPSLIEMRFGRFCEETELCSLLNEGTRQVLVPSDIVNPLTSMRISLGMPSASVDLAFAPRGHDRIPLHQADTPVSDTKFWVSGITEELQTLHLSWPPAIEYDDETDVAHVVCYEVYNGAILKMIQCAPRISSLLLMNVAISYKELGSILELLESSLKVFGVSIENQLSSCSHQLVMIMQLLSKFNPSLEELRLNWRSIARSVALEVDKLRKGSGDELTWGCVNAAFFDLKYSAPLVQLVDHEEDECFSLDFLKDLLLNGHCSGSDED